MTIPLLIRFARSARMSRPDNSVHYDYELDQIVGLTSYEMTESQITEGDTDPTTDESTDR